jgi:MoxR-like ATPase
VQALTLAAKVSALLAGRFNVSFEDIRKAYLPALRHRILLNFEAQAENIPADNVLAQVVQDVPETVEKAR